MDPVFSFSILTVGSIVQERYPWVAHLLYKAAVIRILVCTFTGKPEENLNLLFSKFMTPRTPTIEYHCNIEEHQCYSAVSFAQLQSCIILPSDLCTARWASTWSIACGD